MDLLAMDGRTNGTEACGGVTRSIIKSSSKGDQVMLQAWRRAGEGRLTG
jgi:hypothetical protein